MKPTFRIAALAALLATASCVKDKAENIIDEIDELDQQTELLEQTPLEIALVTDNVVIEGSTKMQGAPPAPNEAITLDVSNTSKTAFLNEGFDILLDSDTDVVGAYLQFKSNDGTVADSYYDINISDDGFDSDEFDDESDKRALSKIKSKKPGSDQTSKETDIILDIDFTTRIVPGTFCYDICVYDAEGNISAPSEVCVTVESWGGSISVLGEWSLVKEEFDKLGEKVVSHVGDPDCDSWVASCENDEQVNVSVCYTREYGLLELKSDGSFTIDFKGIDQNYDEEALSECRLEYTESTANRYQSNGYWAYVSSEKRITLIEYSSITNEAGETDASTWENGDAYFIYDGIAVVKGNSLVISEVVDVDNDGVNDSSDKFYFEK